MKQLNLILIALLLFSCTDKKEPQVYKITADQMFEAIENESIQLIDVRTEEEYCSGKLKNAQNFCVTNDDFIARAKDLDKDKPVYLYCKVGGRSAKAAEVLKEMGFKFIYDMTGGIDEWQEKGFETDKC
jgi:rhodanese-related sulfurtransferase